jgi:2-polyprenyl-6-hydroxyphenyl methylase/3-demethylubiquinone-9 3-methyltransferase
MSAVAAEVDCFNRLATTWWDSAGPMRPLHVINQLRLAYLLELIQAHLAPHGRTLEGLRMLDIGCGAGLLCEPFAGRGADVTGVDAAEKNIAAARLHAADQGLHIDYRVGEPTQALGADERYDLAAARSCRARRQPCRFSRGGGTARGSRGVAGCIDH